MSGKFWNSGLISAAFHRGVEGSEEYFEFRDFMQMYD